MAKETKKLQEVELLDWRRDLGLLIRFFFYLPHVSSVSPTPKAWVRVSLFLFLFLHPPRILLAQTGRYGARCWALDH